MMNPAIGAQIEEDECPPQSLSLLPTTTAAEKRKHGEVGDNSPPQSKPMILPPEKRNCIEIVEQPMIIVGEEKVCESECIGGYEGPTFEELPPYAQRFLLQFRDKYGPQWPKTPAWKLHDTSNIELGEDTSGTYFTDDGVLRNIVDDSVVWSKQMSADYTAG